MIKRKQVIPLEIKNNINKDAGVYILNAPYNPNNQANATQYYEYNLAAETFVGTTQVDLTYFLAGSFSALSARVSLPSNNVVGVVRALNTLNLGLWFNSGSLVYTYNDNFVFNKLEVL